jgi:YegS/Rv2252/BmrU family lipid kinase
VEGKIIEACEQQDVECTIEFTQSRGHATELASDAAASGQYQKVVAVGGDGTVNEVARGLLHSPIPMGVIPKGSGNGLARHLRIPMNIAPALDSLFKSNPMAIDSFQVNGRLSLNVSGIGFDGHIANLFANDKKRGLQGYAKITMKEFFSFREFDVEMEMNGQVMNRKAFVIAIANSSQYGNNARIAPAASVCDHLLHISLLKKVPPYRLDVVYSFFNGTIDKSPFCEILETDKVTLRTKNPVSYHIDGEPCGSSSVFDIVLLPSSLQFLIPPHTTNP